MCTGTLRLSLSYKIKNCIYNLYNVWLWFGVLERILNIFSFINFVNLPFAAWYIQNISDFFKRNTRRRRSVNKFLYSEKSN